MTNDPRRLDPLGITGKLLSDKYRVQEVVGEGGFCVVYKAQHTIWHQPVALKVFKILANAPIDQRQHLLDSFIQEGRLMASLSSRSAAIVQARDIDTFTTDDGQWLPYMVLEWLDGEPLDLVLRAERDAGLYPRQIHEAMALLEPAAVAFDLAHQQGVAHRDVKPANIFVLGDPRGMNVHVKVLDFGIAKVMAEHAEQAVRLAHTGRDITAFTPNYGAPEQFSRQYGATGPWTDVFAMALIVVEVLRGGVPALDGDDFVQIGFAARDPQRRPTPRNLGVEVSSAVEAVFQKALAVMPVDRFHTMGDFWRALHQAVFPGAGTWNPSTIGLGARPITASGVASVPSTQASATRHMENDPDARTQARPYPTPAGDPHRIPSMPTPAPMSSTGAPPAPQRSAGLVAFLAIGAVVAGGIVAGGMFYKRGRDAEPAKTDLVDTSPVVAPSASVVAPPPKATSCPADMALVPTGKFFQGTDDKSPMLANARPAHKVALDGFCIDVTEVTVAAYTSCSEIGECKRPEAKPSYPKRDDETEDEHDKKLTTLGELCNFGKPGRDKHPVNCVTWSMADTFCKVKGKRLPTEAEWEFSARGADGRRYPWGDDPGDERHMNACGLECNRWEVAHKLSPSQRMYEKDDGFEGTAPVMSFEAGKTKFGLYDVIGNVFEWTSDWFGPYAPSEDELPNPKGAESGERRVVRGGAFNGGVKEWLDPAFRWSFLPTASSHGVGFRCAKSL